MFKNSFTNLNFENTDLSAGFNVWYTIYPARNLVWAVTFLLSNLTPYRFQTFDPTFSILAHLPSVWKVWLRLFLTVLEKSTLKHSK